MHIKELKEKREKFVICLDRSKLDDSYLCAKISYISNLTKFILYERFAIDSYLILLCLLSVFTKSIFKIFQLKKKIKSSFIYII